MISRSHILWKNTAADRLRGDTQPNRLALLHAGVIAGAQLLLAVLTLLLENGIAATGGLSGIGMRSVLGTIQTVLQYAVLLLLPFWEIGFLRASLNFARGERANAGTLTAGLRRFGPVLRLILLKTLLMIALLIAAINVSSVIFTMTPFAAGAMELLRPVLQATSQADMETLLAQLAVDELLWALAPALILSGVLFLGVYLPLFYRIRMAEFFVVDDEKTGAVAALLKSVRITKGNALQLLHLDLSFWWFYVLQVLITVLGFGDVILGALGISGNRTVLYLVFLALQEASMLLLYWAVRARVQTSYAVAYDALTGD